MDAIGDADDGNLVNRNLGPYLLPYFPGDSCMELADTIGPVGQTHGQNSHAKVAVAIVRIDPPEPQEFVPRNAQARIVIAEIAVHQIRVEPVDASRHRCVGGEHVSCRGRLTGLGEGQAVLFHQQPHPLQGQKGRMSLVHVAYGGSQIQRLQGADATDAQEDLLADAHVVVAAIELVRDIPILWTVAADIGIE